MAILTTCESCGRTYKVDVKWSGQKLRCKECGSVMQVPGGRPGGGTGPGSPPKARAAAPAKPSGAREARSSADDPFDNVDALLAIEQSGEVEHEDPQQIKAKLRAMRKDRAGVQAAPVAPADAKVGAPVERKKSVRKVGPQPIDYAKPRDGVLFVDEAYFRLPGEDGIDRWAPIASIGLFILTVLAPIFMLFYAIMMRPDGTEVRWGLVWRFVGWWMLIAAGISFFVLGVMAGLASVGVLVAGGIMKFPKPTKVFLRCATALCVPIVLHMLLAGIAGASSASTPGLRSSRGIPTVWWFLLPFLILGILWLMLRLKPAPFGVTAGMFLALGIGLPALILMVFAMAMGMPAKAIVGGGARPTPAGTFAGGGGGGGGNARVAPNRPPASPMRSGQSNVSPNPVPNPAPPRGGVSDAERRTQTEQNFRKIHEALVKHAAVNNGRYPPLLEALSGAGLDASALRSASGGRYIYEHRLGPAKGPLPAEVIVVYDPSLVGQQRASLFADGRVEWMEIRDWHEALRKSSQALNRLGR